MCPPARSSTPLPFTTLFRSRGRALQHERTHARAPRRDARARGQAPARAAHRRELHARRGAPARRDERELRSEEHTSELQSLRQLVCRLLLEKKKNIIE